jgi:hypothetical protein
MFKGQIVQKALYYLTLEDGTNKLSQNINKELPLYTASFPRRVQISSTSWQKSEITCASFLSIEKCWGSVFEGVKLED